MSKYKATAKDGGIVFGDDIRWNRWGWWLVRESGETLFDPDTIEDLSDGEQQMNEIKKCPFCGSEPVIEQSDRGVSRYGNCETVFSATHNLRCPTCGITFGSAISEYKLDKYGQIKIVKDGYKLLVDRWNERVEEPQERKES